MNSVNDLPDVGDGIVLCLDVVGAVMVVKRGFLTLGRVVFHQLLEQGIEFFQGFLFGPEIIENLSFQNARGRL